MNIERIRQYLNELWNNEYAVEAQLRKASTVIAVVAIVLGVAVLLVGW